MMDDSPRRLVSIIVLCSVENVSVDVSEIAAAFLANILYHTAEYSPCEVRFVVFLPVLEPFLSPFTTFLWFQTPQFFLFAARLLEVSLPSQR